MSKDKSPLTVAYVTEEGKEEKVKVKLNPASRMFRRAFTEETRRFNKSFLKLAEEKSDAVQLAIKDPENEEAKAAILADDELIEEMAQVQLQYEELVSKSTTNKFKTACNLSSISDDILRGDFSSEWDSKFYDTVSEPDMLEVIEQFRQIAKL